MVGTDVSSGAEPQTQTSGDSQLKLLASLQDYRPYSERVAALMSPLQ